MMKSEKYCLINATLKKESLEKVMLLDEFDFTNENIKIFQAIEELYNDNQVIDLPTLAVKLNSKFSQNKINEIMTEFSKSIGTWNIDFHIKIVKQASKRKKIIAHTKDLIAGNIEENKFTDYMLELNKPDIQEQEYIYFNEMTENNLDDIFQSFNYVETGFEVIDKLINGFFNTQLITLAARPGVGKSALALQIALNINDVLFFSLEMDKLEIYSRILSGKCDVEAWRIEGKKFNLEQHSKIQKAHLELRDKMKMIFFDKVFDFTRIKNYIKSFTNKYKIKLIIIDYLQLITGVSEETKDLKIAKITGNLKQLAKEIEVPIMQLSQLTRANEKEGRKPRLSDLRYSGAIEQDSDVVIFLHCPEDEKNEEIKKLDFIIAKNRKGKVGEINLYFEGAFTRFKN